MNAFDWNAVTAVAAVVSAVFTVNLYRVEKAKATSSGPEEVDRKLRAIATQRRLFILAALCLARAVLYVNSPEYEAKNEYQNKANQSSVTLPSDPVDIGTEGKTGSDKRESGKPKADSEKPGHKDSVQLKDWGTPGNWG